METTPLLPVPASGRPRCSTLEDALKRAAHILTNEESRAKIEKAIRKSLMITYEVTVRHRPQDGVHVEITARRSQHNKVAYFAGLEGPSPEPRPNPIPLSDPNHEPGGNDH